MSKNFSAADVSEALDSLLKAGLNADQIVGGALSGALQIAACGDLPAWQAADYAAAAINRVGLNAACLNAGVSINGGAPAADAARQAIQDWEWKASR